MPARHDLGPGAAGGGRLRAVGRSDQGRSRRRDRVAQRVEVVAALEEDDEPARPGAKAATRAVRSAKSPADRPSPVSGSARWRVEAGRDQHPGGRERARPAGATTSSSAREVDVAASCRPGSGKLTSCPSPGAAPVSSSAPGARIERPLVHRHVEDPRVVLEDVLGAVAVVRVPVDDEHPLAPARPASAAATAMLLSRQKPIARVAVAWCPGGRTARKAASPPPASSADPAADPGAGGQLRRPPRPGPRPGCRASMSPPPAAQNRSSASR